MTWNNEDKNFYVLQEIEVSLMMIYKGDESITDSNVMMALEKGKIAVKQKFGYGKSQNGTPINEIERSVIDSIVNIGLMRIGKINDLNLDEYVSLIGKVARSVDTHRQHGIRGYYDFVKNYVS